MSITIKFELNQEEAVFCFELNRYAEDRNNLRSWELVTINGEPSRLVSRCNRLTWCGIDTPQTNRASIQDLLESEDANYEYLGSIAQDAVVAARRH